MSYLDLIESSAITHHGDLSAMASSFLNEHQQSQIAATCVAWWSAAGITSIGEDADLFPRLVPSKEGYAWLKENVQKCFPGTRQTYATENAWCSDLEQKAMDTSPLEDIVLEISGGELKQPVIVSFDREKHFEWHFQNQIYPFKPAL